MTVLVAVSGGVDSVVLLDLAVRTGERVAIAHVHHGLRAESDEESRFVRDLAKRYGVPCHETRLSFRTGSNQADYREARYRFFEEVMWRYGYNELWTAHHADDQLETVLIQLHRRVREVSGIPDTRSFANGRLVRPLLFMEKRDIYAYAEENGLDWREDASNEQLDYLRNRIRHEIVPLLEANWPDVRRIVAKTALRAQQIWRERYERLERWLQAHGTGDEPFHVKLEDIRRLQEVDRFVLSRLLYRRFGVDLSEAVERLLASERDSARYDVGGGWYVRKYDGVISLLEQKEAVLDVQTIESLPAHVLFGEKMFSLYKIEGNTGIPFDELVFPLTIRLPEPGDKIAIGHGTKKIGRVLIDAKIPREERLRTPLLVNGDGRVLAILGVRVAAFQVKSDVLSSRLMVE